MDFALLLIGIFKGTEGGESFLQNSFLESFYLLPVETRGGGGGGEGGKETFRWRDLVVKVLFYNFSSDTGWPLGAHAQIIAIVAFVFPEKSFQFARLL